LFGLLMIRPLTAAELLKNGTFETGDTMGWNYWETYPWDGDGAPVESPAHVSIEVSATTGSPLPHAANSFFALTQHVNHSGTARGGLYQEVKVVAHTPYVLTGHMSFSGDDTGDVIIVGILDDAWNPALAFTTLHKHSVSGSTFSPWIEFSIIINPAKNVITVFTETRQDFAHGNVVGWYDDLSLLPVPEPTKLSSSQKDKRDTESNHR